jgi:hypothetical protein
MNWSVIIAAIIGAVAVIVAPLVGFLISKWKTEGPKFLKAGYKQEFITFGARVAIRTWNGKYVTSDLNNDNQLVGNVQSIEAWQIFEIVDPDDPNSHSLNRPIYYGGKVAFKAINNNQFVGVDYGKQKELKSWVTDLAPWESFTLVCPPKGTTSGHGEPVLYGSPFALQALRNEYVRQAIRGDGQLVADVTHIDVRETFIFVKPPGQE